MNRNQIVKSLMSEGFTEKTLINFSDKQLSDLYKRVVNEADIMISKDDPQFQQKVIKAKGEKKSIETYEEKNIDELLRFYDDDGKMIKDKKGKSSPVSTKDKDFEKKTKSKNSDKEKKKKEDEEIKEWVLSLAENNYHSFTSKGEIMELIQTKMNDVEFGPKVKKGHNGIPEFMSYDAITKSEISEDEKTVKPKPKAPVVKPGEKPGEKPKNPYKPGKGPNPAPKAFNESKNENK